jgi:Holliday junction resolvase RusA-like endonuclease
MPGNMAKRSTKSIYGRSFDHNFKMASLDSFAKVKKEIFSAPAAAPGPINEEIGKNKQDKCINCNERRGLCTIFKLMGDPIPLARPRFYASKGLSSRTHVYDAQKRAKMTSIAEIKRQFEMHHSPNCVLDGVALRLDVCFTLATPKSQKMQYSKLQGKPHIIRPDTSNMIKYIEDVCSGLIYRDDALISRIVAYKRYGLESYTEFKITVIE